MNRAIVAVGLCALLILGAAGCNGTKSNGLLAEDFTFDGSGWGGLNLKYAHVRGSGELSLASGVLFDRDFRWRNSEFSFEFFDRPDLVWGIVLLDDQFREERRRLLENTVIKTAPSTYDPAHKSAAEYLWTFDRVLEIQLVPVSSGLGYKVLRGWWKSRILKGGVEAVQTSGTKGARIRRNAWNSFRMKVSAGEVEYAINGVVCAEAHRLQVDRRTDGRLGLFVYQKGGPLLIRKLTLGGAPR